MNWTAMIITLLHPLITYNAETCPLKNTKERKLMVFERKFVRKIFESVKVEETGVWRVRKNNELKKLTQKQKIIDTIRS